MNSIKVTAYAKVNLFLKILGKRKDSYHNILTLFERISLADEVTISKARGGIKVLTDKFITRSPKDNLVYKAAELVIRRARIRAGVRIHIKKRIPIAGGMGGGSSDAAAVLTGLNELFRLDFTRKELMRLGSNLGADVPFFLLGASFAIGKSKGNRLNKVKAGLRLWHLILYPDFGTSAGDIYHAFDKRPKGLTPHCGDDRIWALSGGFKNFDMVQSMMHNDLGGIVVSRYRSVGNIIERLANSSGNKAMVSGSGPSVFCLCRTRKEAMSAKDEFLRRVPARGRKGWQIAVAETA